MTITKMPKDQPNCAAGIEVHHVFTIVQVIGAVNVG